MPAPEQFSQPRPLEAAPTDYGELAPEPTTSPRMEQVVTQLAAAHGVDLSQKGTNFTLDVPDQPQRWMIGNIDGERIGVTRLQKDQENGLAPQMDIVFQLKPEGWEPVEVVHTEAAWQHYARNAPTEPQGDFNFAAFADQVAQALEQEGWLDQGHKGHASISLGMNTLQETMPHGVDAVDKKATTDITTPAEEREREQLQTSLDTVALFVERSKLGTENGPLFESMLDRAGLLKRLEQQGVVPLVRSPNPVSPGLRGEHQQWWQDHPQQHEAFTAQWEKRKQALSQLYLGTLLGHYFGDGILNSEKTSHLRRPR